jgi:hypothetical protein
MYIPARATFSATVSAYAKAGMSNRNAVQMLRYKQLKKLKRIPKYLLTQYLLTPKLIVALDPPRPYLRIVD